jgi:outer membrane immunogenic protein
MPVKAVKAPLAAIPTFYNWSGFYVGGNVGYAWDRSNWSGLGTGDFAVTGGLIGLQAGYNWQLAQFVVGLEADVNLTSAKQTTFSNCPAGCTTSNTWLATTRGRLGYVTGDFLPYITGGGAYGNISTTSPSFGSSNTAKFGWTIGGGLEIAITQNLSAKAEFLYVDLGTVSCGLTCGSTSADRVNLTEKIARIGFNYRFPVQVAMPDQPKPPK